MAEHKNVVWLNLDSLDAELSSDAITCDRDRGLWFQSFMVAAAGGQPIADDPASKAGYAFGLSVENAVD